ncbi:flagellar basal body rod protein FlgB [Proteiniborus sp.]|uniref:flagellar basal body rod protein FlgB n=1 Tax=Proteiniborus sp. TaxID=2079015 RepID=UPI003317AE38
MINKMFDTSDFLKKALDGSSLRHAAISNNIANVNTPGYKRVTVEFENLLKDELEKNKLRLNTTNAKHIGGNLGNTPYSTIRTHNNIAVRRDGNSVNIDVEIAERAKNEIYYNAISRQISRQFDAINSVINEGGR